MDYVCFKRSCTGVITVRSWLIVIVVSTVSFVGLCSRLAATDLASPKINDVFTYPFPHFTWSAHHEQFNRIDKPVRYEIEIATDESFRSVIDRDVVFLNRYVHDRPLVAGVYSWRVRAIPNGLSVASWSMRGSFEIKDSGAVVTVQRDSSSTDDTEAVRRAVDQARGLLGEGKTVRLVFPAGNYRFGESFSGGLIELADVQNLIVDGTGARLMFSNRMQGLFRGRRISQVAVMGFEIYYPRDSLYVPGRVVSVDAATNKAEVAFQPGRADFSSEYVSRDINIIYLLDPVKRGRLKNGASNFFRTKRDFERLENGNWTFTIVGDARGWAAGDRFIYQLRSRSANIIDTSDSEMVTAYGITSYGTGNMHYVSIEGSTFNILHCKTQIPDGEWMAGNADGIHVRGHRVGPWIEGSHFYAIGDDGVALFARPASIAELHPDGQKDAVICKPDFFNLEPGDAVSFFQPIPGEIPLETTVRSVRPLSDGRFYVVFEDGVPASLQIAGSLLDGAQIWNRSKSCGDFVVRRSTFENIRRYGVVFRAKRGVVENNVFKGTSTRAITFYNETQYPNGLYPSEVIIRSNKISDSGFDGSGKAAPIAMLFSSRRGAAASFGPRSILIEENSFDECPTPEILIQSTRDSVLRNNVVRTASGAMTPAKAQVVRSENVDVR